MHNVAIFVSIMGSGSPWCVRLEQQGGQREEPGVRAERFGPATLSGQAAVTEVPQTGRFIQQTVISHSSGGRKSEIKVSEGLVSPEASLLGV